MNKQTYLRIYSTLSKYCVGEHDKEVANHIRNHLIHHFLSHFLSFSLFPSPTRPNKTFQIQKTYRRSLKFEITEKVKKRMAEEEGRADTYAREELRKTLRLLCNYHVFADGYFLEILLSSLSLEEVLGFGVAHLARIEDAEKICEEARADEEESESGVNCSKEVDDEDVRQCAAIFILTHLDIHEKRIQEICKTFDDTTIFCALPSQVKKGQKVLLPSVLTIPNHTIRFTHFPLLHSPFAKNSFVLPSCPLFPSLLGKDQSPLDSMESFATPSYRDEAVDVLAESILVFLKQKPFDVFVMGKTAEEVGRRLLQAQKNRSSSISNIIMDQTISLILIDRTLDLVAPVVTTNFMDRICDLFLPTDSQSNDIHVDIANAIKPTSLSSSTSSLPANSEMKASISLLSNPQFVEQVMRVSDEEICQFLCNQLRNCSSQTSEVVGSMIPCSNRKSVLDLLSSLLQTASFLPRSFAEVILSFAAAEVLNPRNKRKEEKRQMVEGTLLAEVIRKSESVCQLAQLVKEKFSAENILESAVIAHSVGGRFTEDAANDFARSLGSLSPPLPYDWAVMSLLPILESIRNAQRDAGLTSSYSLASQKSYDPLLPRVVDDVIFRREAQSDVKYVTSEGSDKKSGGLGGLLSGGWGWKSCPRPSDHETIIVYVIGGVTCDELRRISDVANGSTHLDVLVGSDRIITRRRMLKELFSSKV